MRWPWTLTLPSSILPGQEATYDVIWGKIKYFGWNEFVPVARNFPNHGQVYAPPQHAVNSIRGWLLTDDLALWRLATKLRYISLTSGDTRAWAMMNASTTDSAIVGETILRHEYGQPLAHLVAYGDGKVLRTGSGVVVLVKDNQNSVVAGIPRRQRFGAYAYDMAGNPLSTYETPYEEAYSAVFPNETIGDRLWVMGRTSPATGPHELSFRVLDSLGTEVIQRTVVDTIQESGASFPARAIKPIGGDAALIWNPSWRTASGEKRTELRYQVRDRDGQIIRPTTVLTPVLPDDDPRFETYPLQSVVSDRAGRVWLSYVHLLEGQPTESFYMILGADGGIATSPVRTPALRRFKYVDSAGLVWAKEGGELLILNRDGSEAVARRPEIYIPTQAVAGIDAFVTEDGYRLYDRRSPQSISIDIPQGAIPGAMHLLSLDLWAKGLHPANLVLTESALPVWTYDGQFVDQALVDMCGILQEGPNVLTMSQDDIQGGQILVTFPYAECALDLPGDGDCDCDIDLADFLAFTACFDGPATPSGGDCAAFDLDRDGDTDLADLLAFQARFTGAR